MKKNRRGEIVSVRHISEIDGPCVCSLCGETWVPSLSRDCFPIIKKKDGSGEMPLECETCLNIDFLSQGIDVVEMDRRSIIKITRAKKPKT